MPELVACPSCGCRVQVSEAHLGRRTRCIACGLGFVAEPAGAVPVPAAALDPYPLRPTDQEVPPPAAPPREKGLPRDRLPLCPGCSRPVSWEAEACPYCGHLFDPLDTPHRAWMHARFDGEHHRGGLIDTLGTVSLIAGFLTLCTGPVGFLVAVLTGVPAWVMASLDLPKMESGLVDPGGRSMTRGGRGKAIAGVALGVVFGFFFLLVFAESWFR